MHTFNLYWISWDKLFVFITFHDIFNYKLKIFYAYIGFILFK